MPLDEDGVPRLAVVSISGGQLTDESVKRIEEYINDQMHGAAASRSLIIEAHPDEPDGPMPIVGIDWACGESDEAAAVLATMEAHKVRILNTFRVPMDKLLPPEHLACRCETAETSVDAAEKTPKKNLVIPPISKKSCLQGKKTT